MTNSPGGFFILDLDLWGGLSIDLDLWGGLSTFVHKPPQRSFKHRGHSNTKTQQKAGTPVPAYWSYLV